MLAEFLLTAGLQPARSSLKALALKYSNIEIDKEIRETFVSVDDNEFTLEQLEYAARDAMLLHPIYEKQSAKLKELGLENIAELEFALIEPTVEVELSGMKIDVDIWTKSLDATKRTLFYLTNEVRQALPPPPAPIVKEVRLKKDGTPYKTKEKEVVEPILNIDSWQQLGAGLKDIGINLEEANAKTRKGLTNNTTLKYALSMYSSTPKKTKVLRNIIKYRNLNQINKNFGDGLLDHAGSDGRIHSSFNQDGTVSGRYSCVPLDSEILTDEGWKKSNEVSIGDKVVGYNIQSKQIEWTTLRNIIIGNDVVGKFSWGANLYVKCTKNHKWVATINDIPGFIESKDIDKNRNDKVKFTLRIGGATGIETISYNVSEEYANVWCPVTDLSTWFMRQNGHVLITGNSSNPNLENIPKKGNEGRILRSSFIPEDGCKFILGDWNQLHLRIAADCSEDPLMMSILMDESGDLHRGTAAYMYGIPYNSVSAKQRGTAKSINFGLIYGMGSGTLAETLGVSLDEAKEYLARYKNTYPKLIRWLEDSARKAISVGYSKTIKGRIRFFPTFDHSDGKLRSFYERVGKNNPILGTDGDMLKTAVVLLYHPLLRLNARIVNLVHDEIIVEAPTETTFEVAKLLKETMFSVGQRFLKYVPTYVDVRIRDSWWKDEDIEDDYTCQQLWLLPQEL